MTVPAVPLSMIALPQARPALSPIAELGAAHGLNASKIRMLTRYFGLNSVAQCADSHPVMCVGPVTDILACKPDLLRADGLLVYAKTQTHNTPVGPDWLPILAREVGLGGWEVLTLSMNHCASGLAALDLLRRTGETRPVILLTGEKCFHGSTCRQSGAVLGEMPVAVLLNHASADWRVTATRLVHVPRFHANPDRMGPNLRREFERDFGAMLQDFLAGTLEAFDLAAEDVGLVVPYNLNLPLLGRLAEIFGWEDRMFTRTAPTVGHLFCSDVFYNLAQVLPHAPHRPILCFAAGMGASFAAALLEQGLRSRSSTS